MGQFYFDKNSTCFAAKGTIQLFAWLLDYKSRMSPL